MCVAVPCQRRGPAAFRPDDGRRKFSATVRSLDTLRMSGRGPGRIGGTGLLGVLGLAVLSACGRVSPVSDGGGGRGGGSIGAAGRGGVAGAGGSGGSVGAAGVGGAAGASATGAGGEVEARGGSAAGAGVAGGYLAAMGGAAATGGAIGGSGDATVDASAGGMGGGKDGSGDADARVCTVKINEVQTGGTTALDEFVELYNTCPDKAVDSAGYTLVYRAAAGTTEFVRVAFTGTGFAAGKPFFVCANTGYAGAADAHYTDGLADLGGSLALRGPDTHIVDAVGWGTATNALVEGAPAPAPPAGQSISRTPDGHDTDDNAADFRLAVAPTTPGGPN